MVVLTPSRPRTAPPSSCLVQGRLVVGNNGEDDHVDQVTGEVEEELGDEPIPLLLQKLVQWLQDHHSVPVLGRGRESQRHNIGRTQLDRWGDKRLLGARLHKGPRETEGSKQGTSYQAQDPWKRASHLPPLQPFTMK